MLLSLRKLRSVPGTKTKHFFSSYITDLFCTFNIYFMLWGHGHWNSTSFSSPKSPIHISPKLILFVSTFMVSPPCRQNLTPLLSVLVPFQIQANPSQSMLILEGEDVGELDKAMQHISYLNSRQFPTPGIRRLKITSTVK